MRCRMKLVLILTNLAYLILLALSHQELETTIKARDRALSGWRECGIVRDAAIKGWEKCVHKSSWSTARNETKNERRVN